VAHDVFISYSSKDKPTADAVCATLESRGVRCWIAPRDVLPGEDYAAELVNAIHESRLVVLVFSAGANQSPQVLREMERAVNRGLPILPLRIENVPPSAAMEYYISSRHWLDALTTPLEQHLVHLADSVQLLLSRRDPPVVPQPLHAVKPVPPIAVEESLAPPPPPVAPRSRPPEARTTEPAAAAGQKGRNKHRAMIGTICALVGVIVIVGAISSLLRDRAEKQRADERRAEATSKQFAQAYRDPLKGLGKAGANAADTKGDTKKGSDTAAAGSTPAPKPNGTVQRPSVDTSSASDDDPIGNGGFITPPEPTRRASAPVMVGRVDVSHFAGLKAGDTPEHVASVYGAPVSDSGGATKVYRGDIAVGYKTGTVNRVELRRNSRDLVQSRAGSDGLLDLFGRSESEVVALLGTPTARDLVGEAGYSLKWKFSMPGQISRPGFSVDQFSGQTLILSIGRSGCGFIQITW
jgi:hypothetical protein